MLDIGVFAPFGTDFEKNIAFCVDGDVHHIIHSAAELAEDDGEVPEPDELVRVTEAYGAGGVTLASLRPPRTSLAALRDPEARRDEMVVMTGIVKAMGKAGIPYLHLYSSNEIVPGDGPERECLWAGLVEYYRELTDVAEDVGVKVSTHHFHRPDRILWNLATMERLFQEVDSPANGVIFCQGKSELAGDDLGAAVRAFGNRTFMVHIRDIVTRVTDPIDKEVQERLKGLGYLEVAFGTGEVNMVETFKALKEIDYKGQIYPEHFPSIAGDRVAGLSWTIGYMKALDQVI